MKKLAGINKPKHIGWKLFTGTILTVVLLPIILVISRITEVNQADSLHMMSNLLPLYAINTSLLLLGSLLVTLFIGVSTAWFVSVYEFPFRKTLEWMLILPLAIPTYINAISYVGLSDYAGPIRIFLRTLDADIYMDIMNKGGAILVISLVLYPYVYISTRTAFLFQSGALIEVSQTLGKSMTQTFFRVALPLAWPAIFSGLMLVTMEVLNDYGVVHYFGIPTLTIGIFKAWLSLGNLPLATALSLVTLLLVILLFVINEKCQYRKRIYPEKSDYPLAPIISKYPRVLFFACLLPLFFGFIVPVTQLAWWAMLAFDPKIWHQSFSSVQNTFVLGSSSALIVLLFSIIFAYTFRITSKTNTSLILSRMPMLGYAIPGAVISIGIVSTLIWINPTWIYFGIGGMIYGYSVRFFALGLGTMHSGYDKIPIALDMAGSSLGQPAFIRLIRIHLPILKPALIGSFIMIFVDVAKELPLTLLLRPFNFETLSTQTFQYAKDEMAPKSAFPGLLIIFVSTVFIYHLHRLSRRKIAGS